MRDGVSKPGGRVPFSNSPPSAQPRVDCNPTRSAGDQRGTGLFFAMTLTPISDSNLKIRRLNKTLQLRQGFSLGSVSGLCLPGSLGGIAAAPERSGIDAVGIEGEHTIVKFL